MLRHLYIKNYALIEDLDLDLKSGLSIITGETGAGKSILLGALGLVLGNRADSSVLNSKEKKCIVEATFDLTGFDVEEFFNEHDLDKFEVSVLRRELTPDGRSRAFINDTPVNLNQIKELASMLIDIHSQHQVLQLKDQAFRLRFVDSCCVPKEVIDKYRDSYIDWKDLNTRYTELSSVESKLRQQEDYIKFQFDELNVADLKEGELEMISNELSMLDNAEDIKKTFTMASQMMDGESGVLDQLRELLSNFEKIAPHVPKGLDHLGRLKSTLIDLKDLNAEFGGGYADVEYDPDRVEELRNRVDLIQKLLVKHDKETTVELLQLKEVFDIKLESLSSNEQDLTMLQSNLEKSKEELDEISKTLSLARKEGSHELEEELMQSLHDLGLPDAAVILSLSNLDRPGQTGQDHLEIGFSANKGQPVQDLSKVASGGELSRVMLAFKSLMAGKTKLPSIVFDEVDTGVSGDVADRMGKMINKLGQDMQVLAITHLPQIAAKGDHHFKVYKTGDGEKTATHISMLNDDERVEEIAKMLSAETPTEAARTHAKELVTK
ncbi:MAG: DNA repair protein RecN (Recombination protein N) [Bacteroidia bacterium]|jgi:DNA repair protein RecN (Recombination protein N)